MDITLTYWLAIFWVWFLVLVLFILQYLNFVGLLRKLPNGRWKFKGWK